PWTNVFDGRRSKRVTGDVERPGRLDVSPGKCASEIKAVCLERVEVSNISKIKVQDRSVVFAGRDEHGGFVVPQKIMRILRMQREGVPCSGKSHREQEQTPDAQIHGLCCRHTVFECKHPKRKR